MIKALMACMALAEVTAFSPGVAGVRSVATRTNNAALMSTYAEYLAKINGGAPPAAAPPAAAAPGAPAAPAAPAAQAGSVESFGKADPTYDPWMDDDLTIVTFMVNGQPKKYRVMQ